MATYTYSLSADFGNQICLRTLTNEINAESAIVATLSYITVAPITNEDDVDIVFTASLSTSEITALSAVVSAHDGSVCPEPASFTGFTVPVSGVSPVTDNDIALKSYTDSASANALALANAYTDSLSAGGVNIYDNGALVAGSPFSDLNFINTTVSTSGDIVSIETDESVFGTEFQQSESSGQSGTTGDTFQNKISLTPSGLPSGLYRIGWYCELQETDGAGDVESRLLIDGSIEKSRTVLEPQDVANWYSFGGFGYHEVTGGSMTVQLQWREVGGGTAYIRNARVEIWRIN